MRNLINLFILLFVFCPFVSSSQCISGNCENGVGVYVNKDKSKMEGSWKNGKLDGKSKITFASGAIYEGDLIQGIKNGFGKYIFSNGNYYEGGWKNDKQNGEGKFVTLKGYVEQGNYMNDSLVGFVSISYSNGDKYSGFWKNGKRNGAGKYFTKNGYFEEGKYINDTLSSYATIIFPSKAKYIGYVQNSLFDGKGIYFYSSGDKFEGNWKRNKKNGTGTLYFQKGGILKGEWIDDVFVSGSNSRNIVDSLKIINPILSNSGIYEVNVFLNNVLKIDMVFDTGASEVYFTPDVVLTLFKTKTITEEDLLEGAMFMDANGNVNKSARFNLKSMQIGNIKLENIPCAVSSNVNGSNLLGLSALRKLGKFEFDFNQALIKVD